MAINLRPVGEFGDQLIRKSSKIGISTFVLPYVYSKVKRGLSSEPSLEQHLQEPMSEAAIWGGLNGGVAGFYAFSGITGAIFRAAEDGNPAPLLVWLASNALSTLYKLPEETPSQNSYE